MTNKGINRRDFISTVTKASIGGLGMSILPAHVLGGNDHIPPSDKVNIGLIGFGAQSYKMLPGWLNTPEFQFISVCDPNKHSYDYPDWGGPRGELRGFPGGREVGRQLINNFYSRKNNKEGYNGCTAYIDYREMMERETGLDAVFIMTPDHLHAHIAVDAMKKGLMLSSHKPIGNFWDETRITCETARSTGVRTHLFAFNADSRENYLVKEWIDQGVIGQVKELHRWTNRPMWPQGWTDTPEKETIPEDFNWDLWLGPAKPREYSPDYTHALFRGWHEFGSGCLGDMGYYGYLRDWRILNLSIPNIVEASANVYCELKEFRSSWITNTVSFPHAATIQWDVPVNDSDESIEVFWYEGGLRPNTPPALREKGRRLGAEGVMYIGDDGIITANYGYGNPEIHGIENAEEVMNSITAPDFEPIDYDRDMIESFMGGNESRGNYLNAQAVAETICIGNIAIRTDQEFKHAVQERIVWDLENLTSTNVEQANKFVSRDTRPGWEL
jgi:hypothetical protein